MCNKLPQILAAWQRTLCHITVDIKELGNCLADWFYLWVHKSSCWTGWQSHQDWWALEHLLSKLTHGCWHTWFLCLLARGFSSSAIALFIRWLTIWQFDSLRAKGETDTEWGERERWRKTENSRGKSQPFITLQKWYTIVLPYAIGHRDHPGAA